MRDESAASLELKRRSISDLRAELDAMHDGRPDWDKRIAAASELAARICEQRIGSRVTAERKRTVAIKRSKALAPASRESCFALAAASSEAF